MSKAPSTSSAMVILAVFLCLAMTQHEAHASSECLCFPGDNTCSDVDCDISLANCVRTEFSPAFTGNYGFNTETKCQGLGICSRCQSCANIYKISGGVETWKANCHTNECEGGDCTQTCSTVSLIAGASYVIYVCKLTCPGPEDYTCNDCPATCTAYACVFYGPLTVTCEP